REETPGGKEAVGIPGYEVQAHGAGAAPGGAMGGPRRFGAPAFPVHGLPAFPGAHYAPPLGPLSREGVRRQGQPAGEPWGGEGARRGRERRRWHLGRRTAGVVIPRAEDRSLAAEGCGSGSGGDRSSGTGRGRAGGRRPEGG